MLHTLILRRLLPTWLALAAGTSFAIAAAELPPKEPPAAPPTIGVVVLPFQNATGDPAWDDWRQALPALVRTYLNWAEFTRITSWQKFQPALVRAGWTNTTAIDAKLARQIAQELKADVAVWGSFRHLTNGWAVDAKVLRAGSEAAPVELHFTSPRWVDLAESLALGLAKQLDRPVADDDRQLWRMHMPDSEKADGSLAKAIALAVQEAPAADREQAWREVLAVDPRCGFAHNFLCSVLGVNGRQGEVERAVCELVLQQPRLCSARLTLAGLLRINDDKPGAERELREALQLHRGCPEAVEGLVRLLAPSERWADLTNLLEQAHLVRPHALNTTIFLAGAREQNGDTQGAHDLLHSMDGLPEENEIVDAVLLQTAFAVGELELAGRELLRLGPQAAESERIRDMLGSVKFFNRGDDSSHSNAPVVRPRIFGPGELSAELDRRLTAEERKLVVNPIELTPELTAEARRLTVGFTNDWLRAFALFAEVAQRGRGPGDGGRRTASEALKDSGDPQTRFACQEYAKLFVALARVLGLEAWLVHIELCADGSPAYHDCAALFLEGQGLLIDPTWRVFGISHQVFTVLDDVQTISHQTMQLNGEDKPDPQRLRAGLKLYPEDRWTRLQFVRGMAKAGELDTAAEELRKVQATGAESWDVYEAAAELEMASEHWQPALAELQRALALNPSNTVVHVGLASVYRQLNDSVKSTAHMERAIELDRGELSKEFRRVRTSEITMMKTIARGSSGDPAVRAELQRQAESGDLAAQFALAKALFEQKPPRTEEGLRWNLMAAKQGEDQAQFHYAKNLLVLRGPKAGKEAVQWFTRSAAQGNDDAQYLLGLILYEGKLVPEDRVAAAQWTLLAAAADNSKARYLLKELQLFLSAEELAEARKRADAFKPVKQSAASPQK